MKRNIALQLYSLRAEVAQQGMASILKQVADMGYSEVEPAGFGDLSVQDFVKACGDNGLKICSSHTPGCNPDNIDQAIETAGILGLKWMCVGYGSDQFKTLDTIKAAAERTNIVIDKLEAAGLTAFQHNHYWEFALLDGRLKYEHYIDLCPRIKLELDVFWSANFGANNAVAMVKRFADRVVLLHVKDGMFPANPEDRTVDLRPLGTGMLDIPGVAAAVPENVTQIIVELDKSNIDMTESVRMSHDYLVKAGLGK